MRLITIPLSHFCEKARWGLAHAGVKYSEEPHLQVFHYLALRPYRAGRTVPVLITPSQVIPDSTAILQFLDRQLPESRRLYPQKDRAEIESLESRFDEQLGIETRRWVYFNWLTQPRSEVLKIVAQGTPSWQRACAPLLYPMMSKYLGQRLAISEENMRKGLRIIDGIFDEVAQRLGDGRAFLCGSRMTAADITFASLAAPVLLPPEYGIKLPTLQESPAQARADVQRFRAHPAGQFAMSLFKDHRR